MENLCSKCHMDPVFLNGLCEDCYEEQFEEDKEDKIHGKMVVHGASLKNQALNRDIEKINKLKKNN